MIPGGLDCTHRDRCDGADLRHRRGDLFDGPHKVSSFEPDVVRGCVEHGHVTEQLIIDRDQGWPAHYESGTGIVESGHIDGFQMPFSMELGVDRCRLLSQY